MGKKIGQAMIERGFITPLQLDRALKAQLISGGHLGTNLIELGFTSEDDLGRTLAEVLGVRRATREDLERIPDDAIALITRDQAERHGCIPLRLEDKTLHLAVIEPRKLAALSTGMNCKIVPWVAPEIRILEALETYYGVRRRSRYLRIIKGLEQAVRPERIDPIAAAAAIPAANRIQATGQDSPASEPEVSTVEGMGSEFGYGRNWQEIADQFDDDVASTWSDDDSPVTEKETGAPRRLDEAAELLSRAESRQDLAAAVLGYASSRMSGAMLLAVKNDTAQILEFRGIGLSREKLEGVRFPVTSGSIFQLLLGNEYYRGEVPDDPGCSCFYGMLDMMPPDEVLLLPVYLQDRLVALFYGEARDGDEIEGSTRNYRRLVEKLSLAMKMLVLKRRIRTVKREPQPA